MPKRGYSPDFYVIFTEVLQQEAHGSYRNIRQSYQKKKYLHCVQFFFMRMRHRLYENRISGRIRASECEHMKACQIRQGAKFGKKHMAAIGVQDTAIRKKYINCIQFCCENASPPVRK